MLFILILLIHILLCVNFKLTSLILVIVISCMWLYLCIIILKVRAYDIYQ